MTKRDDNDERRPDPKTVQRETLAVIAWHTVQRLGMRPSSALTARAKRCKDHKLDPVREFRTRGSKEVKTHAAG